MPVRGYQNVAAQKVPCALTIAGSDSGGGAGIQADLKTFAALGVHGASAITCITAQNPREVRGVTPVDPGMVLAQIEAVFDELKPRAVKTGMLFSVAIIRAVLKGLEGLKGRNVVLIVDPVMVSTSGARLLQSEAIEEMKAHLIPRASLVTPNLDEAEILLGHPIKDHEALRTAGREFHARHGCPALLKGGHLKGAGQAIDFYFDGQTELMLEAPRVRGVSTHGTGCTYSAAIAAHCALGRALPEAVAGAKEFVSNAIAASRKCGGYFTLNSFWKHP